MIYLVKMFIIFSECSAESMQEYDTSLIYLNWMQVYQLAIDTILFYQSSATKFIIILRSLNLIIISYPTILKHSYKNHIQYMH
jgi:hypothetical protein